MLKVGIVGCGKIADSHAAQIAHIPECRIVAVCDQEELMAAQLAERFGVERTFTDVRTMIAAAAPEVVHITTPPQSHFALARLCLESGCHVYVEKPFTVTASEARQLVAIAEQSGRKITVGHDSQFTPAARRMRDLVESGYLGGIPVHMESTWCYDFGDPTYAKTLLGDRHHWVRRLPGKLLHNVISHGIAKIAEYMPGNAVRVTAQGFVSPWLSALGETEIVDELRVLISNGRTTAYFTFSAQMRPALDQFCIYGPKNGILLDKNRQILLALRGKRYKSYAEKFIPPVSFAGQYAKNWAHNIGKFLTGNFHMDAGKGYLIGAFYQAVRGEAPIPIPYDQIVLTATIMDAIFAQLAENHDLVLPAGDQHSVGVC